MHIDHPRGYLIRTHYHIVEDRVPVFGLLHGIHRNFPQITCLLKVVKRLRRRLLVQRVVVNRLAQYLQIVFQHGFSRTLDRHVISSSG